MATGITIGHLYLYDPSIPWSGEVPEENLPVDSSDSSWGTCRVRFHNYGASPITVNATVEFINPQGVSEGKYTRSLTILPGSWKQISTDNGSFTTFDKVGLWKVRATDGIITKTWDVLNISEGWVPPPNGELEIEFDSLYVYKEGQGIDYYESDLPVDVEAEDWGNAHLFFHFRAQQETADTFIEFLDPDGISRGKYSKILQTDQGYGCLYVNFDKPGLWRIRGALNGLIQTWDALIVAEGPPPPPPPPPPPEYVCPYCGASFETQAELDAHIEAEHPDEPPPDGAPDWEKYAKWGLIGGGALLIAAFVIRPIIRGLPRKEKR